MVKGNQLVGINFNLSFSAVGLNEIVVSAAKKKQKITKAPATISTVNNMSIREQTGLNNYAKLVTGLKGVDVSYYGIQGAQINARGFSGMFSTRFKQYKNGLDMAELFSSQIYPQISSPPKETIEKIEVVFGPQSSLYGADASTGLLNIIPRDPRYNQDSEANISYSAYGGKSRYRFGSRFAQKISDNWAWDIATEISQAEELDYGNTVKNDSGKYIDPVSWYVPNIDGTTDTLHLKDDYYGAMDQSKFQLVNNILHTFSSGNLLRISPGYIRANGYTMGSVGPYYTKLYEDLTFEVQYTTDMQSLRYYYVNQGTIAASREPLAKYQATNGYSFQEALEKAGNLGTVEDREMWTNNYEGYSHLVDYQLNYDMQLKNRQLEFVGGFDYDFIDPNSNRQMYDDNGYDYFLDTLVTDKADIKESRYGTYIQLGTDLSNSLSITGSARYDWHEAYGSFISPKLGIVKENFLNGSLKFMVGRGFKAPFLNDRYIYTGAKTYKAGPGYSLDLIAIGNRNGFTLNNFMDINGNGVYEEDVDELLYSKKIDPLELEITNTIEMSYSGLVRKNLIFELGAYVSQYENFKTALKHFGTTGPGAFSWADKTGPFVSLDPGSYIEILQGDNRLQANTIAVTYESLPVKTSVWGFETGLKYYSEKLTFDVNYTHFNDNDLVMKREKGKKYNNAFIYQLSLNEVYDEGEKFNDLDGDGEYTNEGPDTIDTFIDGIVALEKFKGDINLVEFDDFRKIYSNTPNHQMNLTVTAYDVIKKGVSLRLQLRGTTEFEFASGWFEATKEGSPDIQDPYKETQSFYKNKGPVGGGIYTAVNIGYSINENLSIGLAINNLFESNAVSFPLTPVIPRTFVLETGYKF
jgi:iron complex outermembrane receptor protein